MESPDLERLALLHALETEACGFGFFQAVRLLEQVAPNRQPVGRFSRPASEAVRFSVHPSLAFPASEIQSLVPVSDGPPVMTVNFMGLIGPQGVLPNPFTELVRERMRAKDNALRDFLDIFQHRLISLFYRAWEKYRVGVAFERGERDRFSLRLLHLLGLGTPGLQDRLDVPDDTLLFYGGLLALNTRPAVALQYVLEDYFDVPVAVEQFVGAWYAVEEPALCHLGDEDDSTALGSAVAGDEVWDQGSRIRVTLGPLGFARYEEFLPGGAAHRHLHSWVTYFTGPQCDVEIQLVLQREEVPECELYPGEAEGFRLGWTTWIRNAPFGRDPGDAIFDVRSD